MKVFRFITPLLVSIAICLLSILVAQVTTLQAHFLNHLGDHKSIELVIEKRLTCIETQLGLMNNYEYGKQR